MSGWAYSGSRIRARMGIRTRWSPSQNSRIVTVFPEICDERIRPASWHTPEQVTPIKNPAALAAGLISLFFSKEVTANSVLGYRNIVFLDLDFFIFVVFVLLASKSLNLFLARYRVQLHFAWAN